MTRSFNDTRYFMKLPRVKVALCRRNKKSCGRDRSYKLYTIIFLPLHAKNAYAHLLKFVLSAIAFHVYNCRDTQSRLIFSYHLSSRIGLGSIHYTTLCGYRKMRRNLAVHATLCDDDGSGIILRYFSHGT